MALTTAQFNFLDAFFKAVPYFYANPRVEYVKVQTKNGVYPVSRTQGLNNFRQIVNMDYLHKSAYSTSGGKYTEELLKDNNQLLRYIALLGKRDPYLLKLNIVEPPQPTEEQKEDKETAKEDKEKDKEKKKTSSGGGPKQPTNTQNSDKDTSGINNDAKTASNTDTNASPTTDIDNNQSTTTPASNNAPIPNTSLNNAKSAANTDLADKSIKQSDITQSGKLKYQTGLTSSQMTQAQPPTSQANYQRYSVSQDQSGPAIKGINNPISSGVDMFRQIPSVKPNLSIPSGFKTLGSNSQIQASKLIQNTLPKTLNSVGGGLWSAVRGLLGFGARGAATGAITGTAAAGGTAAAAGGLTAATGGLVAPVIIGALAAGFLAKHWKKIVMITVGLIIGIFAFSNISDSSSLCPPYNQSCVTDQAYPGSATTPSNTSPIPPPFRGNADISSCPFYRGPDKPRQYQSQKLLGYIKEASQTSGIPEQVLAAIIGVESRGLLDYSDEQVDNYQCSVSSSGALGPTQLVPRPELGGQANAYCKGCTELGASYLGKTADTLTREDYCSIKSNILLAAGFTIKKAYYLQGQDGTAWQSSWTNDKEVIGKAIEGYYGCRKYPSCVDGPYDYSEDVWRGVQACNEIINNSQQGNLACEGSWPTNGSISQGPAGGASHQSIRNRRSSSAVDIANIAGTSIYSSFNGTVSVAYDCVVSGGCQRDFGTYVVVSTDKGSITYAHLSAIDVVVNQQVQPGTKIGLMGTTGQSDGNHLHYEFSANMPLSPPNIPQAITPENCEFGGLGCKPPTVLACTNDNVSTNQNTSAATNNNQYWFVLHRQTETEDFYRGIPGDKENSTLVKTFNVNTGIPDQRPTVLPSEMGKEYFAIKSMRENAPASQATLGKYFIAYDLGLTKQQLETSPYGPTPYLKCGPNRDEQCNWVTPGDYGLHGIGGVESRLTDEGSSGCTRHSDADIEYIYKTLQPVYGKYEIRYYIEDN